MRRRLVKILIVVKTELRQVAFEDEERVNRVEHTRARWQCCFLPVAAQQLKAEGVKRADPNLRRGVGCKSFDVLPHLLSSFIRESQGDDLVGGNVLIEQMKNTPYERARLTGSGASGDKQRRMCAVCRRLLAFIKC